MKLRSIGVFVISMSITVSSLAGCTQGSTGRTNTGSTGTQQVTTQQTATKETKETSREAVTIKIMKPGNAPEEPKISKFVHEKIEEKLKTKVEYEYVPSSSYNERVQITFSSGNLPDAMRFLDVNDTILRENVDNGNVIDISPYLKNAPNLMKWTLPESWTSVEYKGGDKKFLVVVSTLVRADGLGIRQDWCDKLGIKVEKGKPITIDQFKDIIKQFALNDPDGNKKNDTYGFNIFADDSGEIVPLYKPFTIVDVVGGAFGLNGWQKAEGEPYEYMDPRFSQKSDKFKKYLDFLAEIYKNKYVNTNYPSIKERQATDDYYKGTVGLTTQFAGRTYMIEEKTKKVNPEAKLTWLSGIINPEAGKVTGTSYSSGAYGGFAITRGSKFPDRVIEWFDYQLSDEMYPDVTVYGGEMGFTLVDGKKVATDIYKDVTPVGGMGDFPILRRAKDPYAFINLKLNDDTRKEIEENLKISAGNVVISKDMGYLPKAASDPKFLDYNKKMIEIITKIAMGLQPSSAYDAVLAGWYKNGGEAYVKEMNEHIKSIDKK